MKTNKKNPYDINTWQQVSNKIRFAESEKQSYNYNLMQKVKSTSGKSSTEKSK
jgi:hypothetical protein